MEKVKWNFGHVATRGVKPKEFNHGFHGWTRISTGANRGKEGRAGRRPRKGTKIARHWSSNLSRPAEQHNQALEQYVLAAFPARRYARYALVRVAVRVRPQYHPMITGLGTMVRLQPPKGHPPLAAPKSHEGGSPFKVQGLPSKVLLTEEGSATRGAPPPFRRQPSLSEPNRGNFFLSAASSAIRLLPFRCSGRDSSR
jgi:hypothetical protein